MEAVTSGAPTARRVLSSGQTLTSRLWVAVVVGSSTALRTRRADPEVPGAGALWLPARSFRPEALELRDKGLRAAGLGLAAQAERPVGAVEPLLWVKTGRPRKAAMEARAQRRVFPAQPSIMRAAVVAARGVKLRRALVVSVAAALALEADQETQSRARRTQAAAAAGAVSALERKADRESLSCVTRRARWSGWVARSHRPVASRSIHSPRALVIS